ncbi:MAG: transcription termination/antitermination NusG family protein, partial [Gammaproteobacteria bacterium]
MAKRWYVVHAYSGFENQVKRSLIDHVARGGL